MQQHQAIKIQQLRLLPFSELKNLKKYLDKIEPQLIVADPYNLYLYLSKNPNPSNEEIKSIIKIKQPLEIIQLIFSESLFETHLQNISLPNSFTVLKMRKQTMSTQIIHKLLAAYFESLHRAIQVQEQSSQLTEIDIRKQILGFIKKSHTLKYVSLSQLFQVFESIYHKIEKKDLQNKLKLIELLISLQNYTNLGFLPSSEEFKNDLIEGLMCWNNGVCSFLAPNIYLELAKHYKDESKEVEIFMDLYSTLNSFGVHLIKDLWEQFTLLCNSKTKLNYISLDTLMGILLRKVAEHNNDNIPKNCIRDLLKSQTIDLLNFFTEHENVVYNQLIPVLNLGQFYVDSPLQKDSKFSKYVYKFFSKAFNLMDETSLKYHLKLFIKSISKWVTYDQSLPAFLIVFNHIKNSTPFFSSEEARIVVNFLDKIYRNVHMRKRWQIVNGILECLTRFLSPEITFQQLVTVILSIPDDAYQWKFIHDDQQDSPYTHKFNLKEKIKKILETTQGEQLNNLIEKLSEDSLSSLQSTINFYRLMRIHKWIDYRNIGGLISDLSKSSYAKQEQFDILVLQMYYQSEQINWKINDALNFIKFYILEHYHNAYQRQIKALVESVTKYVLTNQNQNNRQQLAKFVDFLVYSVESEYTEALYLQYELLLSIIQLQYSTPQQQLQIEESLYNISNRINQLATPKQNRYLSIKLRLQVALSLLLSKDSSFLYKVKEQFLSDPLTLVDRYDYQYYPQVLYFLKVLYIPIVVKQHRYQELDKLQQLLLESILSNLQYSIKKQDIISYVQFILDDRLLETNDLWVYLKRWINKLIKTGANYVYFHRVLANTIYRYLTVHYEHLRKTQLLVHYADILYELLQLEQCRGFDSQVAFFEQQSKIGVIEFRKRLPEKAQYYGMYIRFLFMKFFSDIIERTQQYEPSQEKLITMLGQKVLKFSIQDQSANRMIYSQSFRSKLRLWQFMQVLIPFYNNPLNQKLLPHLSDILIKQLEQPNQPQIKHYIELFITRIILNHPNKFIPIMVQRLKVQASLSQSISNVIIVGLLLKRVFNLELYNALLSLICHNTAYLRGLTQYFCFYNFKQFEGEIEKESLVRKLYEQFVENPDSLRLAERVHALITHYQSQLQNTNLEYYYGLEVYKAGEIVEEYIQDGLKKIGLEIVKQIKDNDEGFILMKDLWKREVEQLLPKSNDLVSTEIKGFQKKIDPIGEEMYSVQKPPSVTKLRILTSNLESIYNYGHLVRTGEIFSLQELAIRSHSILSDDSFKSVSCTGQKWLNIKQVPLNQSLSYILQCIELGYSPVVIDQNSSNTALSEYKMNEKTLLILPNQRKQFPEYIAQLSAVSKVHVGTGLSVHVQSAIFMWQYIRKMVLPK